MAKRKHRRPDREYLLFKGAGSSRGHTPTPKAETRPGGPAGPYRGQSSTPSVRKGGSSDAIVPFNPPTPTAPGVATGPTTPPPKGPSPAKRAATRQQRLVSRFVTKAYDEKVGQIKGTDVPVWEVGRRVEKAKSEVDSLRERLLAHPAVKDANAEGKVVPVKGLAKLHRREEQYHALSGPKGVSRSKQFGLEARSLRVGPKGAELLATKEPTEGDVGRRLARGEAGRHARGEPSTIEALAYASIGIPGIGVGGDIAKVAQLGASAIPKIFAEGAAKQLASSAGVKVAAKAASAKGAAKAIPAVAKAAPKAVREAPDLLRAGAKATPSALKAGGKAAPKFVGKKTLQGGEKSLQAFSGVGALGALHQGGVNVPGGAILEGQAKAFEKDPGKVLSSSTANIAPGLLVSAFQLPVAAGASVATGSSKPLEGALKEQGEFFKHFAETYGGSDVGKIEKATLEEGLLPEILLGPLVAKGISKLSGPVKGTALTALEKRRAPGMDPKGKVLTYEHGGAVKRGTQRRPGAEQLTRQGERNVHRREEAFHAATMNDLIHLETAKRRAEVDRYARKAAGQRTVVREGLGKKGKDTLEQRPPDFLPFLARAGVDLKNSDAALREIQHYAEQFKGLDHPSKYGVNPEALTARDAVAYFTQHPEALRDKNLAKALEAFRGSQIGETGLRSLGYSKRNQYLAPAVMHDIRLPEERVPLGARSHTDATTREGAWTDLNARTKQVSNLRKEGRKKYDQAQEASPKRAAKLRSEAKDAFDRARVINKGRRELHDELKTFTRPGAKADPNAKRTAYDKALEDEFAAETQNLLKERGLNPEPAYVPDQAAISRAAPDQSATGGQKPLPGAPKINEGFVWKHGLSRQGYEHLMNEGIMRQVARNHQFEDWRRFRADRGIQFEGAYQHTGKDWARAFSQGVINRKDVTLVPTQVVNRLEKQTQGGDPTAYEQALAEAQAARKLTPDDAQSGTVYEAFPKAAYEEKVAQVQRTPIAPALRHANTITSKAMLSTPSYVLAQLVSETAQAVAEGNPLRLAQGLRKYNKLTPEQKLRISGASGETAKAIFSPEDLQTTLGSYDEKPFVDALSFFRRNVFGRTAKSVVAQRWAGELNRATGSVTRRAVMTGEIMRDVHGFNAHARRLLKIQTAAQKELRGKTDPIAYVAEHPKLLDHYQKSLHEAMGGWSNLTRTGRLPENYRAAALVFYPFLRMSIQWPLKYAQRHPIKATALAYLSAQNNFALREALNGDPSFLNYAQIPVYGVGKNGEPAIINLSRVAPGGNALVAAVQGSGSALGVLQPVVAAGVMGATGQGPLGPVEGGVGAHVKASAASILGLSPYVRAADTLAGQKASGQSDFGILGERANIALEPLAALSAKLKGSKAAQLQRSLAFSFLPLDVEKQRDSAKLGRILTKLGDTGSTAQAKQQATTGTAKEQREVRSRVQAMQKENAKAEKELEAMYAKYGLKKVAARSLDVYKYTHPYPEEEKKGPYEGSGYEGSGYEGTGYGGGGNKEKPVPVPRQTDGVGFNLPGLGGALGAIVNPLAAAITGETAQAAGLPKERKQVARALKKAEGHAPKLTGPLTSGQKEFAQQVARETGLDARVIGAQALAEESGSYAQEREGEGNHNWLNIGYFDSGPGSITQESAWSNPKSAAKATSAFLKGQWGGASSGIQAILPQAKGQPPATQIAAIANSGWATSPTYQQSIEGTYNMIGATGGKPIPKKLLKRAEALGVVPQAGANKLHKRKGPLAGSRRFVSEIIGQPVWGDKELGHSTGGDHQPVSAGGSAAAYAQDINQPTNLAAEGEPAYDQKSLNKITKDLRRMGADVPDLVLGDPNAGNWEGNVNGYRVQVLTNEGGEVSHIHVGARWTGEEPPPGTEFGEAGLSGSIPAVLTAAPAGEFSASPSSAKKKKRRKKKGQGLTAAQRLKLVNEISAGNLEGLGIPGFTPRTGSSISSLAALGRSLEAGRQELARL